MVMLARSESKISESHVLISGSVLPALAYGSGHLGRWLGRAVRKMLPCRIIPSRHYFLDSHVVMSLLIFDVKY